MLDLKSCQMTEKNKFITVIQKFNECSLSTILYMTVDCPKRPKGETNF